MPTLKTVYQTMTGKPVYEGFAADPSEQVPGNSVIGTDIPEIEPGQVLPWTGKDKVWVLNGERVEKRDFTEAVLTTAGLGATLQPGHVFGETYGAISTPDSHTFSSPAADQGIALDLVLDGGQLCLQPYTWDPATEEKGELPEGLTLVKADVLRGVLPAGATSLDELEEE